MKRVIVFILLLFVTINGLNAQNAVMPNNSKLKLDCRLCHTCDTPTKLNPCLSRCPRNLIITTRHSPNEAPIEIILDQFKGISDLFEHVNFPHKAHAQMAEMNGGCSSCHHYTPNGKITPCRDCHEKDRKISDISKPDLKGAYHQECLGCHRRWSHSIKCEACHSYKFSFQKRSSSKMGSKKKYFYSKIREPEKLVFQTANEEAPLVTFFHSNHVRKFDLKCKSCHKNEKCRTCHDIRIKQKKIIRNKEPHDKCSSCHNTEINCSLCHSTTEQKSFNHFEKTGFQLGKFHVNLKCTKCHKLTKKSKVLSKNCNSCHSKWNSENFDHRITGLKLNETHSDFECELCHINRHFSAKPKCSECHDEEISFPKYLPGNYIGRKTK